MTTKRWIQSFANGRVGDRQPTRARLGDKGAGLSLMANLGLPVPPGFTIITQACSWFFEHGETWPHGLDLQLDAAMAELEKVTGRKFSDPDVPLLVSVRSGAAASMPGMMDTVLNLGLNDSTVGGLAAQSGSRRFAWDTYRRFIQMFCDVVLGIHYTRFSRAEQEFCGSRSLSELDEGELAALCERLRQVVIDAGHTFPDDPREQLRLAIDAVFRSYNSHRARYFRKTRGIPDDAGTAVTVQMMVFGNLDPSSGTGTAFTRDPETGAPGLVGAWLPNAQGEEVVAGEREACPLNAASEGTGTSMESALPDAYEALRAVASQLEDRFRDMQDIEFTVERGQLFLLQTRRAKRRADAAVRVAVDMVREGLIDRTAALRRVDPRSLEFILRPIISPEVHKKVVARGLDASPGAASGRVVFEAQEVRELFDRHEPAVLVRVETSPEDIGGISVAEGVLTARGGQTSHAAVVARGMGKPCVVGCTEIQVDYQRQLFYAGDTVVRKGDWITIDGGTGEVMEGRVEMLEPTGDSDAMSTLLGWADEHARLEVRANADTGPDARRAKSMGALGIGLCRTEHMFFQPDALRAVRRMILADDAKARRRALREILPIQRAMFREIFEAMDGYPVTIRLLDPPLQEFLPVRERDVSKVARDLGVRVEDLRTRLSQLHEANPMMGHRGVRMAVTTPEVYRVQVRAIFEAACELVSEGLTVLPEVMLPLVALEHELELMRNLVLQTAGDVIAEFGTSLDYKIGSMIELPRAALLADRLARHADFFSFGTNDLTQMTFGFSRDDMGKFFPDYQRQGILSDSPLAVFDADGVGQLVRIGTERGREAAPLLKVGICGEHGGDPVGIAFFHEVGLDYVSCSPYRVPVARLAAAHASLGIL